MRALFPSVRACEMLVYVRSCWPVVSVNVLVISEAGEEYGRRRPVLTRMAGGILGVARRIDERQPVRRGGGGRITVGVRQSNRRNRSPGDLARNQAVMPLRAPDRQRGIRHCEVQHREKSIALDALYLEFIEMP
jgi:hypothetical protein